MRNEEQLPSEQEWRIMEILWEHGTEMTSRELIRALEEDGQPGMSDKMTRVLLGRLCAKGLLTYRVDERDSRVYHYSPLKSRAQCRLEKAGSFVKSFFGGDRLAAAAALLSSDGELSGEQIDQLEQALHRVRED